MTTTGLLISLSWDLHPSWWAQRPPQPGPSHHCHFWRQGEQPGDITMRLFLLGKPQHWGIPPYTHLPLCPCPGLPWLGRYAFLLHCQVGSLCSLWKGFTRSPRIILGSSCFPVESGYPETKDNIRILLGPFSPPQSSSASAALYEKWAGCATTLAVPAAKRPPERGSSPPPDNCNPGM